MADFALPVLTSTYSDLVDLLKARDTSCMKLFDGTTDSNLPSGTKRWNSTNYYFEKFDGSAWSPLAAKYMINVDLLDGCTVNDGGNSVNDLWTADKITTQLSTKLNASSYTAGDVLTKLKTVDGSGSGLDADLLDGMNAVSTNTGSSVVSRDANGNFSAGTITANLSGAATSAVNQTAGTGATCDAKFKNTLAHGTSFSEALNVADAPNLGRWFIYSIRHSNNGGYWGTQIAYGWEDNANSIYQRNMQAGTWSGWTRVDVSGANITELVNNAGFITSNGRAYPRTAGGGDLNFYWSGQGGQPSWLWGGNDGVNMYIYNPSNFNVNYANSSGNADTVDGLHAGSLMTAWNGGASLSQNGYQKFSNGFLIQWGRISIGANATAGVTLPTSFPNANVALTADVIDLADAGQADNVLISSVGNSSFNITNGLGSTRLISWIAIGY